MPNLNQVNIIGHLTHDPELRYTPKGTAVAEIRVALNREWKAENGAKKTEVTFIECIAWTRLAEVIKEFLHKGDPVFFSGRLKMESWTDKTTQKQRHKIVVVVEIMQLLKSKPQVEHSIKTPVPPEIKEVFSNATVVEEEIPF